MFDIDICRDSVVVEGSVMQRPTSILPGAWLDFWDRVKGMDEIEKESFDEGYKNGLSDRTDCWNEEDMEEARKEGVEMMKERFRKVADSIKDLL